MRETAVRNEERYKEAEKDVARLKRDIEKQETRHFHELRDMRQQLTQTEADISRLRTGQLSSSGFGSLGYSGSGRSAGGGGGGGFGHTSPPMASLQRADSGGGNSSEAEMSAALYPAGVNEHAGGLWSSLATVDPTQLAPIAPRPHSAVSSGRERNTVSGVSRVPR
jgi:hypothetical protein